MAKRVVTQLIDDIDGAVLEAGEGECIEFAFYGARYQIDLSPENAARFREAMAVYLEHATPLQFERAAPMNTTRRPARTDPAQLKAMRVWLRGQGHEVSNRGRIPQQLQDEYHASH